MLNLDQLKQILDLVRQHELSELEIEQDGVRIKVRKDAHGSVVAVHPPTPAQAQSTAPPSPANAGSPSPVAAPLAAAAPEAEIELAVVKSPIVGTFYRSSEPGAAP